MVPTLLFIDENGRAKVDVYLCRGKKEYDKRQTLKEKEDRREIDRQVKKVLEFEIMRLEEIVKERILILDGAMGTMIQRYGLTEADFRGERFRDVPGLMAGNNDLLSLTRPDVIRDIHRKYLAAGADIIETNTFSSQRVSMADYHVEDYCREINLAACRIARELADEFTARNPEKPRFVAGSVGPTNKTCSMSPDVNNPAYRALTFDELVAAYREQMEALLEGGVDALLIETIFDTLNAKAAIYAAEASMQTAGRKVPLMLSVTVSDKSGRTLSGQTMEAFLTSVAHADIFSLGLNCSFGAHDLIPFLQILAHRSPYYISVYPNAGLPNSMGEYDQTPRPDGRGNEILCGRRLGEYHRRLLRYDGRVYRPFSGLGDARTSACAGRKGRDIVSERFGTV